MREAKIINSNFIQQKESPLNSTTSVPYRITNSFDFNNYCNELKERGKETLQ